MEIVEKKKSFKLKGIKKFSKVFIATIKSDDSGWSKNTYINGLQTIRLSISVTK